MKVDKHLKTGLVTTNINGLITVMDYLDWLKYCDWSSKVDLTIKNILND